MKSKKIGHSLPPLLIIMIMSSLLTSPGRAADVTYATDSYTSGDTLTAADLNAKFNDIKAGVNDNNDRVDSNAAAIDSNTAAIDNNTAAIDDLAANTAGAGVTAGDMQYWNGSAWVLLEAPSPAPFGSTALNFCHGVPTWGVCTYQIGDTGPAGGIVFYVTDGGKRGLEAAPEDAAMEAWGCSGQQVFTSTHYGSGAMNTHSISANCTNAAAKLADDYTFNGYTDWFLPSKDELDLLYAQKVVVGGLAADAYWSSSEFDGDPAFTAWAQFFSNGFQTTDNKNFILRARAVRAF